MVKIGIQKGAVKASRMLKILEAKQSKGKANNMTTVPRKPLTK